MYEEEREVSEIYFITKGNWAISFNSYWLPGEHSEFISGDLCGPEDMSAKGHLIGQRRFAPSYIGDFYCLSQKRSQFNYVALTQVNAFSLTKEFLFKKIFVKYTGLHQEMVG